MKSIKILFVGYCLFATHAILPMLAKTVVRNCSKTVVRNYSKIVTPQQEKPTLAKLFIGGTKLATVATVGYVGYTAYKNNYEVDAIKAALLKDFDTTKKYATDIQIYVKKECNPFKSTHEMAIEYNTPEKVNEGGGDNDRRD